MNMNQCVEYEGYLWLIEKIEGEKVYLKSPHAYLILNEKSHRRIVNKKDLGITDKKDNKNE
jgi:hypothetical protein